MKFSIIVPVYKVQAYLPECVDSILAQTYRDFELILVDDGSPDNCPQMCDNYAQSDLRVKVIHKENGGLSSARNAGIRAAEGAYLLFIDSDDYWSTPEVLEKLASILKKTPTTLVQFGHQCYYQKEGRFAEVPRRDLSGYNGKETESILTELVRTGNLMISACSMAISTEFIRENQLYFKEGLKTEDLEWAVRLFACKPTWSFSDDYFYIYRAQRAGSISYSVDYKHLTDYCWILESGVEQAEKENGNVRYALMSYLMYQTLIACAFCYKVKLTKSQRSEILKRLKAICCGRICTYKADKKVKLASAVYRIGGFYAMSWILGLYLNNRGR